VQIQNISLRGRWLSRALPPFTSKLLLIGFPRSTFVHFSHPKLFLAIASSCPILYKCIYARLFTSSACEKKFTAALCRSIEQQVLSSLSEFACKNNGKLAECASIAWSTINIFADTTGLMKRQVTARSSVGSVKHSVAPKPKDILCF